MVGIRFKEASDSHRIGIGLVGGCEVVRNLVGGVVVRQGLNEGLLNGGAGIREVLLGQFRNMMAFGHRMLQIDRIECGPRLVVVGAGGKGYVPVAHCACRVVGDNLLKAIA